MTSSPHYQPYTSDDFGPPYRKLTRGVHAGRIVKAVHTDDAYRAEDLCWGTPPHPIAWDEIDITDQAALIALAQTDDAHGPAAPADQDPVELSYTPIDCGFDLRVHKEISIELPRAARLRVRYMRGQDERTMEGTPKQIADELDRCGYRVGSPCEGRR